MTALGVSLSPVGAEDLEEVMRSEVNATGYGKSLKWVALVAICIKIDEICI